MNATAQKHGWLTISLASAAAVANVFAWLELYSNEAEAGAAARNLVECQTIAQEIAQLRGRPAKVTLESQSTTELSRRMEEALKFAELPPNCLARIDPQAARRVRETDLKEQPTGLDLRGVTLKQLVQFLHKLESSGSGLRTKSLHLLAPQKPPADSRSETWAAQVVLTSLVFAPKKTPPH